METMFIPHSDYLEHHGIKGQKWGLRRYQNSDGSYTEEGRKRYLDSEGNKTEKGKKREARDYSRELNRLEQDNAMRSARSASLGLYNSQLENKIQKKEFKGRDATKLKLKQQDATKKMTELAKGYDENSKKMNDLLTRIDADKNYVWRTSYMEYYNYDHSKGLKDIGAQFSGKTNYYGTARGTNYHVKTATDKRKNSAKWQLNKNHYANIPIHTEYYYV